MLLQTFFSSQDTKYCIKQNVYTALWMKMNRNWGCLSSKNGRKKHESIINVVHTTHASYSTRNTKKHDTFLCFLSAGLRGSLQRLQLEYVDVVFANRPDSNTPMEGTWGLGPKQKSLLALQARLWASLHSEMCSRQFVKQCKHCMHCVYRTVARAAVTLA